MTPGDAVQPNRRTEEPRVRGKHPWRQKKLCVQDKTIYTVIGSACKDREQKKAPASDAGAVLGCRIDHQYWLAAHSSIGTQACSMDAQRSPSIGLRQMYSLPSSPTRLRTGNSPTVS